MGWDFTQGCPVTLAECPRLVVPRARPQHGVTLAMEVAAHVFVQTPMREIVLLTPNPLCLRQLDRVVTSACSRRQSAMADQSSPDTAKTAGPNGRMLRGFEIRHWYRQQTKCHLVGQHVAQCRQDGVAECPEATKPTAIRKEAVSDRVGHASFPQRSGFDR